jgi:hypothetical protein
MAPKNIAKSGNSKVETKKIKKKKKVKKKFGT